MADIETRVTTLEQHVSNVMTKLDMFIAESREARQRQDAELRAAREKHDADMREMRERQEAAQAKHNAEFDEMNARIDAKFDSICAKIDGMSYHLRNMTIAIALGYAAMVVAVFLK